MELFFSNQKQDIEYLFIETCGTKDKLYWNNEHKIEYDRMQPKCTNHLKSTLWLRCSFYNIKY